MRSKVQCAARCNCDRLATENKYKKWPRELGIGPPQAAWRGAVSLRGPLCAGEALLEARTLASVALFKLGAHSATAYTATAYAPTDPNLEGHEV